MPRNNSVACRYLVSRVGGSPAVRTFVYFRRWDEKLAAHVRGTVLIDWKVQSFNLTGKSQIKISLKTSDYAIARDRWAKIHAQVEEMLGLAQRAFYGGTSTASPVNAAEINISAEDMAIMVEQRRFDLIEAADRQWEGEAGPSPIKRILELAAQAGEAGLAGLTPGQMERRARGRARVIPSLLHDGGDISRFEFAIRETELDAPLPPTRGSEDVGRIVGEDEMPGMVFDENDSHDIDPAAIVAQRLIQSPAHQALVDNGFNLSDTIVNHRQLAFALLRGEVETGGDLIKRAKGQRIKMPAVRPSLTRSAAPQPKAKKTLNDLLDDWVESDEPALKTVGDARLYVGRFILLHGDLDVRDIGSDHIMAFRRGLISFPRVIPTALKNASFSVLAAHGATLDEAMRLDRRTVNKAIGAISALLKTALAASLVDRNVATGCRLKINDKKERQKLPFTIEELNRLPSSPIFTDPTYRPTAGGGEAAFWLPLLAMFTGCRLEELGQLLVSDVTTIDGIACLSITDLPDEGSKLTKKEANKVKSRAKTVKSTAARRIVPIHPTLIELGFLRYVEKIRKTSKDRLFPALRGYAGKVTKNFSRFINRYIDKHVTDDRRKNFHSFRHGAIDAMRNEDFDPSRPSHVNGVPGTLSEAVGHANAATTADYGRGPSVQKLYREICKMKYEGLDLTKILVAY